MRAALLTFIALAVATPAAHAQELYRPWLDPEAVDVDEESETRSSFWERAVEPNRAEWDLRVKRAGQLIKHSNKQSLSQAVALLREAIRLAPEQPDAHWYLGQVYFLMGKFDACAASRKRTAVLAPDYEVPGVYRAPSNVDEGIGVCLSLGGDFTGALRHFKRTLAKGDDPRTASYAIRWRLGETYMALGRLDEAIGALKEAVRLGRRDFIVHYALATAYDRNEQAARARAAMEMALRHDSTQSLLARRDLHISPPEDVHYYDALAKMQPPIRKREPHTIVRNLAMAIIKFRRFLAEHENGPWTRRARAHIRALSRESITVAGHWQRGAAGLAAKPTRAAIEGAHRELQACARPTPGVLYTVRITALTRSRRGEPTRFGAARPVAGVRTLHYEEIETEPVKIARAKECIDRVASGLKLPKPKGPPGESVTLEFPVVAQ